jgi:hypothetical protein
MGNIRLTWWISYLYRYSYKMADPITELNAVLEICGIDNAVTCTNIITREGFMQLGDLGVLETDMDVMGMAKRMATRTQVEGRVLLGKVVIKQLQMLVWWVSDQEQKRGLALVVTILMLQQGIGQLR